MTTSAIYQQGGTWYIGIVNTNKHWAFMPDPPKSSKGPSITSAFATAPPPRSFIEYVEAMQQGNEDVLQALANPEIVDLAGEEPQWVFNPLYEAAALQEVEGVIIFDAAENGVDDLAADIVADAEAIAEFLALGLLTTAVGQIPLNLRFKLMLTYVSRQKKIFLPKIKKPSSHYTKSDVLP